MSDDLSKVDLSKFADGVPLPMTYEEIHRQALWRNRFRIPRSRALERDSREG